MASTNLATHSASCRRYGQRTRTVSFSGKFDLTKPAQPHEGATVSIRAIRAEKVKTKRAKRFKRSALIPYARVWHESPASFARSVETKRAQRALRSFPYIILWFHAHVSFARRQTVDLLGSPLHSLTAPRESAAAMSVAPVNFARRSRRMKSDVDANFSPRVSRMISPLLSVNGPFATHATGARR